MANASNYSSSCSTEEFPFIFYGTNRTPVDGYLNADGQCVFPDALCELNLAVDECCSAKPEVAATGSNYMFFGFTVIFIPYMFMKCYWPREEKPPDKQYEGEEEKEEDAMREEEMKRQRARRSDVPSWVRKLPLSRLLVPIFAMGLWLQISMQITIPILMKTSLQAKLNVASRNALIAAEAFLVPYAEIFQFIEDIVLVRVNYAMGHGDKELTNRLVHAGIVGSFGTGLIAALIATVIGVIPAALEAVTNPGIANDQMLYPGCNLIAANDHVLPYWLMEVFAIPGTQLGKVMSGFMLGAMELATYGWIGAISLAMIPILWFNLVDVVSNDQRLLLLSTSEFTAAWMLPVLSILYIISPLGYDLRENTGVYLRFGKLLTSLKSLFGNIETNVAVGEASKPVEAVSGEPPSEQLDGPATEHTPLVPAEDQPESTKQLLVEGLKIMVMDVVIQCCISISIYLALSKDAAVAYQLTALQSALPTYGIAYAFGMGIMFKVVAPQLIAGGHIKMFVALAQVTGVCTFLLIPLIMGAVIPFRTGLAFDYGTNACAYAKDNECLPFFANVFGPNAEGGDYTLPFTFDVFAAGACVDAIFFVLRAMLLSLVDLDFMLKGTCVAVIFYVPAIVVATTVQPFANQAAPCMFLSWF